MAKQKTEKTALPEIIGDVVTVIGTEKSKHLKTGKEYVVSARHAETLIKKGNAILKN